MYGGSYFNSCHGKLVNLLEEEEVMERGKLVGVKSLSMCHILLVIPMITIILWGDIGFLEIVFGTAILAASIGTLFLKRLAKNCLVIIDIISLVGLLCAAVVFIKYVVGIDLTRYEYHWNLERAVSIIYLTLGPIFFSYSIYYFTRPKVKEQFK